MITIITEISKYLIIFFMVLYTVKCFTVLKPVKENKKKRALNVQIFYVFIIHFLCYLTLYLNYRELKILIFYMLQIVISIIYMISYHSIYKKSSRLITNNMSFLLLIGYVMLTRLDFNLAKKQFIFATVMLIITAFIPLIITKMKNLSNYTVFYAVAGIVFLMTVFIPGLGINKYGSRNWIGLGSFSLQPMEFVKIIFVFFLASSFEKARGEFKGMIKASVVAAIFVMILVLENDLGGAAIFFMIYIMMVYLTTGRLIFLVGGLGGIAVLAVAAYKLFANSLFSHVVTRVDAWINPFNNINSGGYQVAQSLFAIGSGGFEGTGLCQGLPTSVPVVSSDFIFAAICEELGVIFGLCLLLMYISCFIYFINISMKIRNTFYKNVAFGFTICFIFQTFLNIGGVIKFIPSTGVTLPLVSYGVSSVVSTLIIFGIIQGICVLENSGDVNYEERKQIKPKGKAKKQVQREEFSGE